MSRYIFQKSIAATLGVAIVSTGLFASISSDANMLAQSPLPTASPAPTTPAGGTTTTPVPTTPAGGTTTPPGSTMPNPGKMTQPGTTTTPPSGATTKPVKKPAKASTANKTITEIAVSSKSLSTLVSALKAADLVDTLSGEGPFTVFAPTNAAFAKLPKATLAKLLKPENKEMLKKILTYHVIPSKVTSKMLKSGQQVETVEGSKITVKIRGKKVMINNATVLKADVAASNGVIHSIDTVIMPPTK
jgi:uncharacterized surface protein with fasciclin (FAS1) repeats